MSLSQVRLKGLTAVLVFSVASAVLGGSTQFGYNSGVINSPKTVSPETIPSFIASTGMELEFLALECDLQFELECTACRFCKCLKAEGQASCMVDV